MIDIILTTHILSVSPSRLEDRVSLVDRNINFTTDMSVRQTILFHSLMREPGTLTRGRDTKGRVSLSIIIYYILKKNLNHRSLNP